MSELPQKIHFLGIGGAGLNPLAGICLELGVQVSGSDALASDNQLQLKAKSAKIWSPHNLNELKKIETPDLCVYSTAIPLDNPEYLYLKAKQVKFLHRSELLERIANTFKKQIVITGTHGKTTTTAIAAWIFEQAGLEPTWLLGGTLAQSKKSYQLSKSRELIIFEGDESDQSFLRSSPHFGLVTSLEEDHLENYQNDFNEQVRKFQQFATQSQNFICSSQAQDYFKKILQIDAVYSLEASRNESSKATVDFILQKESGKVWREIFSSSKKELLGKNFLLKNFLGKHNYLNALAAFSLYVLYIEKENKRKREEKEKNFQQVIESLSDFPGVVRRFEIVKESSNSQLTVIDDYAHHPTEVKASIEAAQAYLKEKKLSNLVVLFQPHLPTRLRDQWDNFIELFSELDAQITVLISDLYVARGKAIPEINSKNLVLAIRAKKTQIKPINLKYLQGEVKDLVPQVKTFLGKKSLLLILGAGNVTQIRTCF